MQYASTIPFDGSTAKAFDLAVAALSSLGFRTVASNAAALELVGPGMNSSRQSALVGASRICFTRGPHELALEAELGGVQRLARFVALFPIGLSLFLCAVFFAVFSFAFDHHGWVIPVLAATGGNAVLWLFLAPVMARSFHARTCRALDALLNNMAFTGKSA